MLRLDLPPSRFRTSPSGSINRAKMSEEQVLEKVRESLQKITHYHYPCGPTYQDTNKISAQLYFNKDEIASIYHLKESHAPSLRIKAVELHIKAEHRGEPVGLDKKYLDFSKDKSASLLNKSQMLQEVWEMPKEWTIVQITATFNPRENTYTTNNNYSTTDLFISVFQCGEKKLQPFLMKIPAPRDVSGSVMKIKEEMDSIIKEIHSPVYRDVAKFEYNELKVKEYKMFRLDLNNRVKNVIKDVQNEWLGGWRCLLMGTPIGKSAETIEEILETILKDTTIRQVTEKNKEILKRILLASNHLKLSEIKKCVKYCFPNDIENTLSISKSIHSFSKAKTFFNELKLNSVILIVEEKLDVIPFEMIDVLQNHPITRTPSLHFTYALFKQYESKIKNGLVTGFDFKNGNYILNPEKDLQLMEKRIGVFLENRIPNWSGLTSTIPSVNDFQKFLVDSDLFSYYGHGNGSHFFPMEKIRNLSMKSVVCLFGCSSSSYLKLGPQLEMYGVHQMYVLGCSPQVIGALWNITDKETDTLSTELLDIWLPPNENFNWNHVDRTHWQNKGEVILSTPSSRSVETYQETELLRALCKAKKTAKQILTNAAFVARGLPISL